MKDAVSESEFKEPESNIRLGLLGVGEPLECPGGHRVDVRWGLRQVLEASARQSSLQRAVTRRGGAKGTQPAPPKVP